MTGKSPFQALFLTRLRRPTLTHAFERALDDALDEAGGEALSVAGASQAEDATQKFQSALGEMPGLSASTSYVATPSLAAAYKADAEPMQPPGEAAPSSPPSAPPPSSPATPPRGAAAALEITLRTGLGVDEIKRLRRRFALENHPDRVPTELREEASIAMAEVNAEIDEALKRARKR